MADVDDVHELSFDSSSNLKQTTTEFDFHKENDIKSNDDKKLKNKIVEIGSRKKRDYEISKFKQQNLKPFLEKNQYRLNGILQSRVDKELDKINEQFDQISEITKPDNDPDYLFLFLNGFFASSVILILLQLVKYIPLPENIKYLFSFIIIFIFNSMFAYYYSLIINI